MAVKNQETGVRGQSISFDVYFYTSDGGTLTDPDSTPTYTIYDPDGTSQSTGSGTKVSTGYYTASWTIPGTAEVSSSWYITWDAAVDSVAVSDATEYFSVTAASVDSETTHIATISDYWLNLIKTDLAYPSVDNIILTDTEIKQYCVYPALREYFTKFPIRSTTEHSLSTSADTDIDFPDSDTFGVLDARVVGKETVSGSGLSFWDIVYYQQFGSITKTGSSWGIQKYNPGGRQQAQQLLKQAASTYANQATFDLRVSEENSQITIHTNSSGKANVTWAKMSENFSDVRFVYKLDVVRLAQSYLLEHLARTTGLITNNLEVSVDASTLLSEAKDLREQVIEKWQSIPTILVIRST